MLDACRSPPLLASNADRLQTTKMLCGDKDCCDNNGDRLPWLESVLSPAQDSTAAIRIRGGGGPGARPVKEYATRDELNSALLANPWTKKDYDDILEYGHAYQISPLVKGQVGTSNGQATAHNFLFEAALRTHQRVCRSLKPGIPCDYHPTNLGATDVLSPREKCTVCAIAAKPLFGIFHCRTPSCDVRMFTETLEENKGYCDRCCRKKIAAGMLFVVCSFDDC